mgnify:CR=1 FL=1|tara:strand:+ start:4907 stop:6325 length:1419 start_codon:yes stop_codon:yes gene_type:complete
MAKITRKHFTITPKADTKKLETYNTVSEGDKVVESPKETPTNGCTDPTALNYASDVKGCFNDNGIIVREDTSCCEYTKYSCKWVSSKNTNVCKENGTYVGGMGYGYSTLSQAIADGALCNSGQSCCHYLCDGEYRSDYDVDSTLGVCSNYNPERPTDKQIGENAYGSLEAFNNAITDGIMCNCFSTTPIISLTLNFGQKGSVMYSPFKWPNYTVKNDKKKEHIFISQNIAEHPPNFYITLGVCGYPSRISAFRAPTFQVLESQSDGMKNNTYKNLYGTTPSEIKDNNIQQLTIPNYTTTSAIDSDGNLTHKGKKIDNTQEFNEGLKAGKNIIIIECANGKEMVYTVCVPHQTVPYEQNMWMTRFFNCEGNTTKKEYNTVKFKTDDIDSGFIEAQRMGFKGTKEMIVDALPQLQKVWKEYGGPPINPGKWMSCPKCCPGGSDCFGLCGGGACIGYAMDDGPTGRCDIVIKIPI